MSMFPSDLMNKFRDKAESMLPGTCVIQSGSITLDSIGGNTITYIDEYLAVPCKLATKTKSQGVTGGQFTVFTEWTFHLPYDQEIAVGQRIVYGGDNYDVVGVEDDHDWRVFRNAIVERSE